MNLSVSAIVTITILVLAIVAIATFFIATGGGAAGRAEMQRTFTEGCLVVCSMEQRIDVRAVRLAYTKFDDWQSSCEQLYGISQGAYLQCLEHCACGALPTLCERLQGAARNVGANCPFLCEAALTSNATRLLYKDCECTCD